MRSPLEHFALVTALGPLLATAAFVHKLKPRSPLTGGALLDAIANASAIPDLLASHTFDYVVVGGGTAGLTVAARLSEQARVLALEAGTSQPDNPAVLSPAQAGSALGTDIDWAFSTVPQPHANDRSIYWPRGKVLGGSSAINFLMFTKGAKAEYDAWDSFLHADGWNWSSVQYFSKKSENFVPPPLSLPFTYSSWAHGTGGPVETSFPAFVPPQFEAFVAAGQALGLSFNNDVDDGSNAGVGYSPSTQRSPEETRVTSATAYAYPNLDRLFIITSARVTKINWASTGSHPVASGVTFVPMDDSTNEYVVNVERDVVLSAGTVQTPALLELSGVGNPAILNPLGIQTVVDLPGVGENLQDHPATVNVYRLKDGWTSLDDVFSDPTLLNAQLALYGAGQGMLTHALSAYVYLRFSDFLSWSERHELRQIVQSSTPTMTSEQQAATTNFLNHGAPIVEHLPISVYFGADQPEQNTTYMSIASCLQHSFSRGNIHIISADPTVPPAIDPKYLEHPADKYLLRKSAQLIHGFATSPLMAAVVDSEKEPGPQVTSDSDWDAWVEDVVRTEFHPIGTAAMTPECDGGVVDPKTLKVYRTANVRVVDLSIAPLHISAHPMSLAYAIGERAATLILSS